MAFDKIKASQFFSVLMTLKTNTEDLLEELEVAMVEEIAVLEVDETGKEVI